MRKIIKRHAKQFNSDFKNTTKTAIIAAAGLIAANSWKDALTEYLIQIQSISPYQGKFIIAAIITIIASLVVFISSKLLK